MNLPRDICYARPSAIKVVRTTTPTKIRHGSVIRATTLECQAFPLQGASLVHMSNERGYGWDGKIFLDHDSAQEGCHKLINSSEGEFRSRVEFRAHLLTKGCQYVPVYCGSLDTPIGSVVDVICPGDFVREACDECSAKWLRELCHPVIYHRRQANHESPALVSPFYHTSLLGGENISVPWRASGGADKFHNVTRTPSF